MYYFHLKSFFAGDRRVQHLSNIENSKLADKLIRNTYKTLLSRGQKGCYIYCEDKPLAMYICKMLGIEMIN